MPVVSLPKNRIQLSTYEKYQNNLLEVASYEAYENASQSELQHKVQYFKTYKNFKNDLGTFRRDAEIHNVIDAPRAIYQSMYSYGFKQAQNEQFNATPEGKGILKQLRSQYHAITRSVKVIGWDGHPEHTPLTRSNKRNIKTVKDLRAYRANMAGEKLQDIARHAYESGQAFAAKQSLVTPSHN